MTTMIFLFVGIGGVLSMTWAFPLLGHLLSQRQRLESRSKDTRSRSNSEPDRVECAVIIPAHNEGAVLGTSLLSVNKAINQAQTRFPNYEFRLIVGADGCSDNTTTIAKNFGAEVIEAKAPLGKWLMLRRLLKACPESDWVIFADAGVVWPSDFLLKTLPECQDPSVMAVAPTYRNPGGGKLENILWSIERHLKAFEARSGGPITTHGATVIYRREFVSAAMINLSDYDWINDDVVLPLYLRASFPEYRIKYLTDTAIYDQPAASLSSTGARTEAIRRKRMAHGNVQWIRELFPTIWRHNALVGVLALRRVFRLFWAYWLLMLMLAFVSISWQLTDMLEAILIVGFIMIIPLLLARFVPSLQRVLDAAIASLLSPYYLLAQRSVEGVVWR